MSILNLLIKNFLKQSIILLLIAGLTGCVLGPNYNPPSHILPAKWKAGEKSSSFTYKKCPPISWWTLFHDPVLNILIEKAICNNLNLKVATARILQARANRLYATAQLFPQIDINAEVSRGNPGYFTANKRLDLRQATFDASWEIDFFGKNRRNLEAQDYLLNANNEARNDVLVSLLAEVASTYIDVRMSQKQLQISNKNIQSASINYNITRSLQKAGIVSDLDTAQAQSQYQVFKAQVPLQTITLVTSKNRLTALLGLYPGELDQLLATKHPFIPEINARIILSTPCEMIRERPDIRRAEQELAAQTALIGSAMAELFPNISLGGFYGPQDTNLLPGVDIWKIAPRLHLPILDFGRIRSQIDLAKAKEREAYYSYQDIVLNALADVENQLTGYMNMKLRESLLQDSISSNHLSLSLANERYKKGLSAFINVIQSEQTLYQTENDAVIASAEKAKRIVAIYKSLGVHGCLTQ